MCGGVVVGGFRWACGVLFHEKGRKGKVVLCVRQHCCEDKKGERNAQVILSSLEKGQNKNGKNKYKWAPICMVFLSWNPCRQLNLWIVRCPQTLWRVFWAPQKPQVSLCSFYRSHNGHLGQKKVTSGFTKNKQKNQNWHFMGRCVWPLWDLEDPPEVRRA